MREAVAWREGSGATARARQGYTLRGNGVTSEAPPAAGLALMACRRVLRRRPDPLAPLHRRHRRRPGHGAGEHPGGARAACRVDVAVRAPGPAGAGGAAARAAGRRADLGCGRARRVRPRPDARGRLRDRGGSGVRGLPAAASARRRRTRKMPAAAATASAIPVPRSESNVTAGVTALAFRSARMTAAESELITLHLSPS